jgi:hypothetical protein
MKHCDEPRAGSSPDSGERMITCHDCESFHAHLRNPVWWCFISMDSERLNRSRIDHAKRTRACNYAYNKIKQRLINEGIDLAQPNTALSGGSEVNKNNKETE